MSDELLRRLTRELERRGWTPREEAAAILGTDLTRWWILTNAPIRLESEKCLAYAYSAGVFTWRTPVETIEDLARAPRGITKYLYDARLARLADTSDDWPVIAAPGWGSREDEIARDQECRCERCTPGARTRGASALPAVLETLEHLDRLTDAINRPWRLGPRY